MTREERYELLDLPRCTNCGKAVKLNSNIQCCNQPNRITWKELLKREEEYFKAMLRAEYYLEQRLLTADDARKVLSEIKKLKESNLNLNDR